MRVILIMRSLPRVGTVWCRPLNIAPSRVSMPCTTSASAPLSCSPSADVLQTLPVKEADCLRLYFGLCGIKARSLDEIASRFEVTRERARQIRDKALVRLRSTDTLAGMNVYLG